GRKPRASGATTADRKRVAGGDERRCGLAAGGLGNSPYLPVGVGAVARSTRDARTILARSFAGLSRVQVCFGGVVAGRNCCGTRARPAIIAAQSERCLKE